MRSKLCYFPFTDGSYVLKLKTKSQNGAVDHVGEPEFIPIACQSQEEANVPCHHQQRLRACWLTVIKNSFLFFWKKLKKYV